MLDLVEYGSSSSSDEEDQALAPAIKTTAAPGAAGLLDRITITTAPASLPLPSRRALPEAQPQPQTRGDERATPPRIEEPEPDPKPILGPASGPPAEVSLAPPPSNGSTAGSSRRSSPYTSHRALIRDLTLPPVPSLDIPPSPPGSPVRASTAAKFAHFLALKQQGVHFNAKLAKSSALKNPTLFRKLTLFAGIDDLDQYVAALPTDVYDPTAFPDAAYKEALARSQQDILKAREEERTRVPRQALDFVPPAAAAAPPDSRAETGWRQPETSDPDRGLNVGRRGPGQSAAERVMAGLDRGGGGRLGPAALHVVDGEKRRRAERERDQERDGRGMRMERYPYRKRERTRSRSPGRRRRSPVR
ncbi:MAG: hypothetical protein M1826_000243 [Phylliscum demangeonii]|nr:MAG: hypothetical protein M1826_000243 [Phylliscum demangeonii]